MKKNNLKSDNPILKRILDRLDIEEENSGNSRAGHSSHSSGSGSGHSSYVSSTMRSTPKKKK